jgi:hypothetical protein
MTRSAAIYPILVLLAGAGLTANAACFGGVARQDDGSTTATIQAAPTSAEGERPAGDITNDCPTAATFTDRWPNELAGGMTIGPVTLVLAEDANTQGFSRSESTRFPGYMETKMQIQFDSPSGVAFSISGQHRETGVAAMFTHMNEGATVPPRTQPPHRDNPDLPAFAPGAMLVPEPGCYEVWVDVGTERYGPWGILIHRAGA